MRNGIIKILACILLCYFGLASEAAAEKKMDNLFYIIESAWSKRDGGNVPIICTAIVELIIIAPEETIKWLNSKNEIREELLAKWQYKVFTDYIGDRKSKLQALKTELIRSIAQCTFRDKRIKALKRAMLDNLKNIKIRNID